LAALTIKRSLSIAPDGSLVWIELAEIRCEQGNEAADQEVARKALTLTGNEGVLETRARRLMGC